jgi:hypothetical protein
MNAKDKPPIALIYDRLTTPVHTLINERLGDCERYVEERGMESRGVWFDHGDQAHSADDRPKLDALLMIMRAHSRQRAVVCVVCNWDRLGDEATREQLQRRVREAGGWVETADGESDRDMDLSLEAPAGTGHGR